MDAVEDITRFIVPRSHIYLDARKRGSCDNDPCSGGREIMGAPTIILWNKGTTITGAAGEHDDSVGVCEYTVQWARITTVTYAYTLANVFASDSGLRLLREP